MNWLAICDVCGFKYKASELRRRWDGLRVCKHDWEPRHIQDFVRAKPDQQPLPWTRPEGPEVQAYSICTAEGRKGIAGYGIAGCSIASLNPMTS